MAEPVRPVGKRSFGDQKRSRGGLAGARASPRRTGPGKESQNRPGLSGLVAVIQVVARRVIKIDRKLHQAKAKHSGVEIHILLGIPTNRRYMMNTQNLWVHVRTDADRN